MTLKWVSGYWLYDQREKVHILKDYYPSRWFNVIPESIGMYTGFKAKFGKRIYDGDVFHVGDDVERYVKWENGMFVAKDIGFDYKNSDIAPPPLYRFAQYHKLIFINTMYERRFK